MDTSQLGGDFQVVSQVLVSAISGELWRFVVLFVDRVLQTLPLLQTLEVEGQGKKNQFLYLCMYVHI